MNDLIDRKALMDVLEITMECDDCQYNDTIRKGLCTMPGEFVNACVAITDAPSAEPKEQQEIIRCRDCKHWDKTWTNDWAPDYHYCPIIDGARKCDFYCADAEVSE
jgi:hypothetical protein